MKIEQDSNLMLALKWQNPSFNNQELAQLARELDDDEQLDIIDLFCEHCEDVAHHGS